jgi:hypothetical protein
VAAIEEPNRFGPKSAHTLLRRASSRSFTMLLLLIVLILVFGLGGGYYGHSRWGYTGGMGSGVGTVLVILLIAYLLGAFH